jgi:hypothetical protein
MAIKVCLPDIYSEGPHAAILPPDTHLTNPTMTDQPYMAYGETYRTDTSSGQTERWSRSSGRWVASRGPPLPPPVPSDETSPYGPGAISAPPPLRPARQLSAREVSEAATRNWSSEVGGRLESSILRLREDLEESYRWTGVGQYILGKGFNEAQVWSGFWAKGKEKFASHFARVKNRQTEGFQRRPPTLYPSTNVTVRDTSVVVSVRRGVLNLEGTYTLDLGDESRKGRWTKRYDMETRIPEPDTDEE